MQAHALNKTLVYFLLFTVVSSLLAYRIIVKAYDTYSDYPTDVAQLDK